MMAPIGSGEGRLAEVELAIRGWERIRELNAELLWDGEGIHARELRANVGGGEVRGRATFDLGVLPPPGDGTTGDGGTAEGEGSAPPSSRHERYGLRAIDASLVLDDVRLLRSRHLRLRGSGELGLSGTMREPILHGSIVVSRGIFDQDIYPSVRGGGTKLPFDLFRFDDGFLSRLAFDVDFQPDGKFQIRNNRIRVSPLGSLHLGGTGYQPVLTGAITATDGELVLPRIRFEISNVEVSFPEDDPFRPLVRFRGVGTSRGIEITATADGDLFSPEVRFSSTPSYPEDDLILLVATGRLRSQIASNEVGIIAATELARLYGPQVWGSLFGAGGDESFLDRIEVGALASDDTGEFSGVSVEYRINRWLSLYAEQEADGDTAADLRFFWWLP